MIKLVKNIISLLKHNIFLLFTWGSIGIIAIALTLMVIINIQQRSNHIEYSPNFPVYRSADTTLTALIKNELIEVGKNSAKTQRSMETNNTSFILLAITILTGLFFNPIVLKILRTVKDNKVDNDKHHALLFDEIKIFKTENKILSNLNEILSHHLETSSVELSTFIAHEGRRLIYFAEVVMNSKFDHSVLQSAKVKLDVFKQESRIEITDKSIDFKKKFIGLQCKGMDELYKGFSNIVYDDIRNSKHNRFRILCEQFLENHLAGIQDIQKEESIVNKV